MITSFPKHPIHPRLSLYPNPNRSQTGKNWNILGDSYLLSSHRTMFNLHQHQWKTAPPGAMIGLSLNCHGFTVRILWSLIKAYSPLWFFLAETKLNSFGMEQIRLKFNYSSCFSVPSVGNQGGLALMWKLLKTRMFSPQCFLTCMVLNNWLFIIHGHYIHACTIVFQNFLNSFTRFYAARKTTTGNYRIDLTT